LRLYSYGVHLSKLDVFFPERYASQGQAMYSAFAIGLGGGHWHGYHWLIYGMGWWGLGIYGRVYGPSAFGRFIISLLLVSALKKQLINLWCHAF